MVFIIVIVFLFLIVLIVLVVLVLVLRLVPSLGRVLVPPRAIHAALRRAAGARPILNHVLDGYFDGYFRLTIGVSPAVDQPLSL